MTTVMEIQNLTLEYPVPRKYRKEKFSPSGIRTSVLESNKERLSASLDTTGQAKALYSNDGGCVSSR